MEAETFLQEVSLFSEALDAEQLRFLADHSKPAFFRAGTPLMHQGDLGGSMFVIQEGQVAVTFVYGDARQQQVATLGPRDVVGEMSLFTGDRRTATVSAVTNVTAIEVTKASLERVFARAPELVDTFSEVLAQRQATLKAMKAGSAERAKFIRQAQKAFALLFGDKA